MTSVERAASATTADPRFAELEALANGNGPGPLIDRLTAQLRESKEFHRLFDALLLRRKFELGLPLNRPSSLQDVPDEQRKLVEEMYIAAAREIGDLFLAEGDIPNAWMYHQVSKDRDRVAAAIERLPLAMEPGERLEELLHIALIQGVHPARGVEMMLRAHGTCSTITALDQTWQNLSPEQRQDCAKVMVRSLYRDLTDSVRRDVERRIAVLPPDEPLRGLLAGRDWLLENGNYHIDVSHLHSVVRFARSIEPPAPELDLALQLCEYGRRLIPQLQYGGEPPFEDFYPMHAAFFRVLADQGRDEALGEFRRQLAEGSNESDRPIMAYVLVDLLMRIGRLDEAVDVASDWLTRLSDDLRFSFAELCAKSGRFDALRAATRENGDLVGYAAALLQSAPR
ncbi:MAG: hypothetical protein KF774_21885 [Planctomyces sp.]|nr:hypothetical protein [Planctomyces sp.]